LAAVLAAYAAAFSIACALVYAYAALTAGPDRQTYGAMYGFGDSLLFLALFASPRFLPPARPSIS